MSAQMSGPICLVDYEAMAEARLDPACSAYLFGGSGDEVTLRANRQAFERIRLVPRVMAHQAGRDTRATLFGQDYAAPILVAPMGHQKLFHPAGEIATAQAAAAMGLGYVLSTLSSTAMEDVRQAGEGAPQWFQLYCQPHKDDTLALLRRAEGCGFSAIVVTVDAPINGIRNREMRAGFRLPDAVQAVNLSPASRQPFGDRGFDALLAGAPGWEDMSWLRESTRLPLIIKGILHPLDAEEAIRRGFDGIIVSNHGGRTLDGAIASIDALPAIAAQVARRVPVLLDGGVRRGTDVLKALLAGASAVLVGRPITAALSVNGAAGAAHALRILRDELTVAQILNGSPG
jgi:4-hydroxymandelate oxidase